MFSERRCCESGEVKGRAKKVAFAFTRPCELRRAANRSRATSNITQDAGRTAANKRLPKTVYRLLSCVLAIRSVFGKENKRNVKELCALKSKLFLKANPDRTRHQRYNIAVRTLRNTKKHPILVWKQMHMQSLLRKLETKPLKSKIARRSFSRDRRTPVISFVNPNVSYNLPKSLMSLRLYSTEVEEVVVVVLHRREIAHGPHLEVELRERGFRLYVEELLQVVLGLDRRCWRCCETL